MKDAPRVLAVVSGVLVLQLLFTHAPPMQQLVYTKALSVANGMHIVAAGVLLLLAIPEVEKALLRHTGALA